ncbi:HAMP domain-containing protein [Catalinimonas niigatensis]|uniref:HAMP domain-containing protein n=1 Tax=Catalinimonas niigatensis TaxID=1397264 RepID=UPI00266546C5|nr:HAMP domain-containing protein [Catalinimonas niigatensis]WPP50028.1 HAMP domain-containing protein [Catalinimonas niigatensis]
MKSALFDKNQENTETIDARELLHVLTEVKKGNLSVRMPIDLDGTAGKICDTLNDIIDLNEQMVQEFTKAGNTIGKQGKLTQRLEIQNAKGDWATGVESLNTLISDLVHPTIEIANVISSVAKGNLSERMPQEIGGNQLKGEFLRISREVNDMVKQLNLFSMEVTRVAREVGSEGKLGGQAKVKGVGGVWKDLTDSVNQMASNLTAQVRNIAEVTTAVAKGDLSKKITVDVKGEISELKNTINTMVDQLNSFSSEVTRVALEVGTEGKLGGQAQVKGVSGTWKDLTDSVNQMASNLTAQVRNIAEVTTAVAKGDLSKKITVDVKGEISELKNTINTMVDQLNSFSSEVTRVALEVGTEGKLGGQAKVKGVGGTWKDLTDSVNQMASNLTAQVRNIAEVTTAVAKGDLSKKITVDVKGEISELKNTINTMVDQLNSFSSEVTRVALEVGTDGKLGGQANVPGVAGTWKDLTDSVNQMAGNLTSQVRNIAEVVKAIASGDLSKTVTIDVKGEILDLKDTINTTVDLLRAFASEVTRVAREVGTDGKLGGQATVKGVGGTWKDLTDSVNQMASNLTGQVRGIAKVVTSVAKGNLKQKLSITAAGEVAQLTDTINEMIDTLEVFADQVTTVAREVGVDGKLGGQANVPGAAGTWKDLTENVNQLAENLTTQVRAISEVASAVTKGDLTRTINVEAQGEVEALKDTINQMIANLKETTLRNQEQDWLKSNLAKFTQMLQGQRDLNTVINRILSELAQVVAAHYGAFYILRQDEDASVKLKLSSSYAYKDSFNLPKEFAIGEGLVGQCAFEKERIVITNVPSQYIKISSGLGEAKPMSLIILPVLFENKVKAVIELASFELFSEIHFDFLEQLTESIGIVLNTIETNTRTEGLLTQSQSLADELRRTNEELQDKAQLLSSRRKRWKPKTKKWKKPADHWKKRPSSLR